jgi:hypothetical protein
MSVAFVWDPLLSNEHGVRDALVAYGPDFLLVAFDYWEVGNHDIDKKIVADMPAVFASMASTVKKVIWMLPPCWGTVGGRLEEPVQLFFEERAQYLLSAFRSMQADGTLVPPGVDFLVYDPCPLAAHPPIAALRLDDGIHFHCIAEGRGDGSVGVPDPLDDFLHQPFADRRDAYFPPVQRLHTGDGRCTDYFSYNELRIILAALCNN